MIWANGYLGIPQVDHGRDAEGCDCWGLLRLIYLRELRIALPSYAGDYVSAGEAAEIDGLLTRHSRAPDWLPVAEDAAPFDALLFRRGRWVSHVGVAVDARRMIHIQAGGQAKVERWDTPRWIDRLAGVYRHINAPLGATA